MSDAVSEFWAACCRELPAETQGRSYRVVTFGSGEEMSRRLRDLVATGQKTGTFGLEWAFEANPAARPQPGDLCIVTDSGGEPGALCRITETRVLPFDGVGPQELACEGPGLRELPLWRKVHWDYWTPALQAMGREPDEKMPILFQRFEVLRA